MESHFKVLLALLSVAATCYGGSVLRTANTNTQFGRWDKTGIPYYIDPAYTLAEATMIRQAVAAVQLSLSSCVVFVEVNSTLPVFKIKFTPLTGGIGSPPQMYCYSYPGVHLALKSNSYEQIISLARGPYGCLNSYCQIQKYLALVLGKRNEHQRGDRDNYLTVNYANIGVPSGFALYPGNEALWSLFPYDYCSVTHNQPTDFAFPGLPAFSVKPNAVTNFIPPVCGLSQTDCKLISMMYSCNINMCQQPICAIQAQQATTTMSPISTQMTTTRMPTTQMTTPLTTQMTTTPMTTTPMTTTQMTTMMTTTATPCIVNWCTVPVDEGAVLLDGRQVIFSGLCYAEIDPATQRVKPGTTRQINGLFPNPLITGNVQSVWTTSPVQIHVLLQNGQQYLCTLISCSAEAAKTPNDAVFENIVNGVYETYTVASGGMTYSNDASPLGITPVTNIVCGNTPPCTNTASSNLATWTAGWFAGSGMVNVLGRDSVGNLKMQQMAMLPIPGLEIYAYQSDAAPYC